MSRDDRINALEKRVDDLEKRVAEATDKKHLSKIVLEEITRHFSSLSCAYDHTQQY